LAIGDVNLNEIIYRLNELKNLLLLRVTEKIVQDYDDIITERLTLQRHITWQLQCSQFPFSMREIGPMVLHLYP